MTVLVLALLSLAGCSSDGPEFAEGEPIIINGVLLQAVTSQRHDFTLTSDGTVRIELTEAAATSGDTGDPIADPILGVSIGRRAGTGACSATFSTALEAGGAVALFLNEAGYCVFVFRTGSLPADAVVAYLLTISPAYS